MTEYDCDSCANAEPFYLENGEILFKCRLKDDCEYIGGLL